MATFLRILLFLVAICPFKSIFGDHKNLKWVCSSTYMCVLEEVIQSNEKNVPTFESQNDCRLSCGKYGAIWPLPTIECILSNDRVHFDPRKIEFSVITPGVPSSVFVDEANQVFINNIAKECVSNCSLSQSKVIKVKITVTSKNITLDWETDESYQLTIRTTEITFVNIKATTAYGARHGLETLSNLITGCKRNGLLLVASAHISDRPMFPHRGLLIDTSRHYIPVPYIKKVLDGMAASKLNVFHWHVTDSHSFPLFITRVLQMTRWGAYSREQIYTRIQVTRIKNYANARGIRMLIEIDGPSHSGNGWQWGPSAGLGNLTVCMNMKPWYNYCGQPPCGQLNPMNENMYGIMKYIYEDIYEAILPEETLHMGGDEVHIPCWNATEEIIQKLIENGYDRSTKSFLKLWADFHAKNLKSWDEVNVRPKPVILWSSHLTDPEIIQSYLPNNRYIIQTWVDATSSLNKQLLDLGYKIIVSTLDAWYLDLGFWGKTSYNDWRKAYNNPLLRMLGNLGGEVCLWTEYVDENSIETRVWPRAGAAAERLWSDPETSASVAEQRFYRYRDRLIARGIRPDAVTPKWCELNEGQCL